MVKAARKAYDPVAIEREVQAFWKETQAYERTRKHRAGGKKFYFIDGPPYTSGHIHMGTAWNKTLKDAVVRYKRMTGHNVRDQAGYDMHGLPIENKVEGILRITDKKQIEDLGIQTFVEKCRTFAVEHLAVMTEEFKAIGVWLDWDKPYRTIDNEYMEAAWWTLARAHERGLLYRAERAITWCPHCETALAAAELEYADRDDPTVTVKFPLKGRKGEYLVIWTTTPWTLPANLAIAAHPEFSYAKVQARKGGRDETLWIVENQVEAVTQAGRYESHVVTGHVAGRDLEGWEYEHPFADVLPVHRTPASKWHYKVLLADHVTADNTGLVHTAPGHGAEDFELGRKYGVAPFCPVGDDGRYTEAAGPYKGLHVREADDRVVSDLEKKGLLLAKGRITHPYGHCWRCKTPILFRTTPQWYIAVTKLKGRMLEEVERIRWSPPHAQVRQREWVQEARDWCISRQRYWGIPIPIWQCSCGATEVVGTRADLAKRAKGFAKDMDLHRPWIDMVTLPCPACGKEMRRVPDVLDVWLDSGVAAWAALGHPSRKDEFEKWFPCDFITEAQDQTRGWFYSQLGAGIVAFDRAPYDAVLMHGWCLDAKGQAMSKSLGNVVSPLDVMAKHGADPMRLYLLENSGPGEDLKFAWEGVKNATRPLNTLWNVHVFATQYMALDSWKPSSKDPPVAKRPVADRWLLSRLQGLVTDVRAAMDAYDLHRSVSAFEAFVLDDLSRWYVRLARDRVWGDEASPDKLACYRTLHDALLTLARLAAPFTPHVAEQMYRDLEGPQPTVHMEDYPAPDPELRDERLEERMATARSIVEAASAARMNQGLKLRWPVGKITVAGSDAVKAAVDDLKPVLLAQTNARAIEFAGREWAGLRVRPVPQRAAVGPTFKKDAPAVTEALKQADAARLKAALETNGKASVKVAGRDVDVTPAMVRFETELPEHTAGAPFEGGAVYVDTTITPELREEGTVREVVRRVQESRKRAACDVDEWVAITVEAPDDVAASLRARETVLAKQLRAEPFRVGPAGSGAGVFDWEIEDVALKVRIERKAR